MPLNVGMIGVGEMGRRHAENLSGSVPGATLAAVADIDLDRARRIAAELEIESAAELVQLPGLDAVAFASRPKSHLPAIQAAASEGKHIFCEKPLALTLGDADTAVRRAG